MTAPQCKQWGDGCQHGDPRPQCMFSNTFYKHTDLYKSTEYIIHVHGQRKQRFSRISHKIKTVKPWRERDLLKVVFKIKVFYMYVALHSTDSSHWIGDMIIIIINDDTDNTLFMKMHLIASSAKIMPFCLGLNVLIIIGSGLDWCHRATSRYQCCQNSMNTCNVAR